ncbi:telomerase reverse transcriptase-like [Anoplophora glabripennis]|uniref:telomerase reverse transcriptase-like n=1 Tax=Anoplophora glabripennis TaxID=217634 RepID=UPI000873FE5C|nr:telomerase reverse transcriptase-like [Anoplophora glabripennis]
MLFSKPIESILVRILEKLRRIKSLECIYVGHKITKILDEVIGNDYFGTSQNRKRFYHVVNKITTQSRFECVYLSLLSKGYDIKSIIWLQCESLDENTRRRLLQNTNMFLLRYVVKPLIKHFYHPLKNHKGYEIRFIERSKWHRFQHKILNELLRLKFLTLVTDKFLSRGELKLFPKTSCDSLEYRPIIYPKQYRSPVTKAKFRCLSRKIEKLANTFSKIGNGSLFMFWRSYCKQTKGQTIYGIKLDIKDAFGYVNIDTVCNLIKRSNFSISDKQFIINHIRHQYVTFHKKLYRWNHGLLQGDRLSSSLCNLYMSNFEKEHLQEFYQAGCFLHRIVDDYFFCSVRKDEVDKFEGKVKSVFQLNETKTQRTDEDNSELPYFGQIFNLRTRQVSKYYSFKKDCPIRHKFRFWNCKNWIPEKSKKNIISRSLQFAYNNHCFKKLELNTAFNREETVLKNYFEGMVFIAFKFDAAVMAIREFKQKASDMPFLTDVLEKVVFEYSNIICYKIKQCKGKYFSGSITYMLLKNIAYRAFILVFKRRNEFYESVIRYIKKKCLYLKLEIFCVPPNVFTRLPEVFKNVCVNRKAII